MNKLLKLILEKNYVEADKELETIFPAIMEQKLFEIKKAVAAKMHEQMGTVGPSMEQKRHTGVVEAADPKEGSNEVERGTPQPKPNETTINKSEPGSTHYKNMEEEEQLDEARINIVKARIRGGKVQRRKKVSNVPGMTLRGGTLKRMSAAERRRRKMGARKGKMKRKAKMTRTLMKRKRSLQKRKSLGL
jgi:hypothetical protein